MSQRSETKTKNNGHSASAKTPFRKVIGVIDEDNKPTFAIVHERIKTNLMAGEQLGLDFKIMRDAQLYLEQYPTFEKYCQSEFKVSVRKVERFIAFAEIVKDVRPIGRVPTHESQVRILTRLKPEHRREVWKKACEDTDETPTAFDVASAGRQVGVFKSRRPRTPTEAAAEKAAWVLRSWLLSHPKTPQRRVTWLTILEPMADRYNRWKTMKPKKKS
jgi:hypothetical protein